MRFRPGLKHLALLSALAGALSLIRLDIPAREIEARYSLPDSRFLSMRGVRVHYLDRGAGEPLVLLHGVSASLRAYDDWSALLAGKFRVIRPDLPGAGLTGPVDGFDYSVGAYTDFLREFSDRLGLERFHLAGNSLGGGVAWRFAADFPGRVDRLILVGAIGYPVADGVLNRLSGSWVFGQALRYVTPRFAVRRTLQMIYHDPAKIKEERVTLHQQLLLREGNRGAVNLRLQKQSEDLRPADLKKIARPTLLLWGAEDRSVPLEHARFFERDLPDARLIIFPGAGHVIMEEIPESTASAVERFLQEKS